MCSPTSVRMMCLFPLWYTEYLSQDGAACCILANESFVHEHKLENQAIELVATGLATDYPDAFSGRSAMETVGYRMTQRLADKIFTQAGASRDDVGVVELHDCFAANEACHISFKHRQMKPTFFFAQLVTYPALKLCAFDDAHRFVERGDNTVRRIHLRAHRFLRLVSIVRREVCGQSERWTRGQGTSSWCHGPGNALLDHK
jgi:hypothetical protein